MIGAFQNFRIRQRIFAAVLLPVIGLIAIAGIVIDNRVATVTESVRMERLIGLATKATGVVDELQRERGTSVVYLGSKGTQFGDQLKKRRQATDSALADFSQALGVAPEGLLGPELSMRFTQSAEAIGQLAPMREKIDALQIDGPLSFSTYSKVVSGLLSGISQFVLLADDPQIESRLTAYVHLLYGKERSGQERATGWAGFAVGAFEPALYQRFIGLIAAQQTLFDGVFPFATEDQRTALHAALTDPAAIEVERLRKIALDSLSVGNTGGEAADEWFAAATKRIDLITLVEGRMSEDLRQAVASHHRLVQAHLYWLLSGLTALLVIAAGLATAIARHSYW